MRNHAAFVVVAGCLPAILYCQPAPNKNSFEVAAVRREDIDRVASLGSVYEETAAGIRYRCSLLSLVQRAYGLKAYQLENSTLLGKDLYEIDARLPEGSRKEDIPEMLRSLLEDRFRFSAHWLEKPMQMYRLTVDPAGLKLEPNRGSVGKSVTARPVIIVNNGIGLAKFSGPGTLQQLAGFLDSAMDHPVIDRTATDGIFDISLDAKIPTREHDSDPSFSSLPAFQGRAAAGPDHPPDLRLPFPGGTLRPDAPEINTALKRLGLRLDKAQEDVRILVIDSVDKAPTPN